MMQVIKYKNGNVMINAGKAGMVQGDSLLVKALADMLEKAAASAPTTQTNKTGDSIVMFEHDLDHAIITK